MILALSNHEVSHHEDPEVLIIVLKSVLRKYLDGEFQDMNNF